jgi:hypothetical protein
MNESTFPVVLEDLFKQEEHLQALEVLTVESCENSEHVKELGDFLLQGIPILPSICQNCISFAR